MVAMKLAVAAMCFLALVAPELAAHVEGPASSAADAQLQLSNVMAASNRALMLAERHQKKAIKKAKKGFSQLLASESQALAGALASYGASLSAGAGALRQVTGSTRASLALLAQNATADSFVECARLSAKVNSAEQKADHLVRLRARVLHEGARRAMEPLEDASEQLSRKLGDLSEVTNKAQEVLTSAAAAVDKDQAQEAAKAALPVGHGAPANLLSLRHTLEEAVKNASDAQVAAADRQFSATLAQVAAKVSTDTTELKRQLEEAMESEVRKLRPEAVGAAAAPRSSERLRGVHPKAAGRKQKGH